MAIDAERLRRYVEEGVEARRAVEAGRVLELSAMLYGRLMKGGKLITFGNGGSAADAQHFAAELSGRFLRERRGLPAVALTANSSSVTAIGNDYSFSDIFSRQLEGLCGENDFVVGISTSGNSENVVRGVEAARARGAFTLGLTGRGGGKLARAADACIKVDSDFTPIIQEVHIAIIHMMCFALEGMMD